MQVTIEPATPGRWNDIAEAFGARAAANPESCWCQRFPANTDITNKDARRIVFLSLQGVQFNTKTPHHAVEKYLKALKAPFTFLRPNFFMQNLSATYRNDIRDHEQIVVPAARARTAFVDTDDVGRVAAHVLNQTGHIGKAYTLSGERFLSYYQVARILEEVLGYAVTYTEPTVAEYVGRLESSGATADYRVAPRQALVVTRDTPGAEAPSISVAIRA